MAVSTELATPLTLKPNQVIRVEQSKDFAIAYNDPQRNNRHYRNVPNDDESNEGLIKWANLPSVEESDGTYMVAVSMFEYVYVGSSPNIDKVAANIENFATQKKSYEPNQGQITFPIPGTVKIEGPRVTYRKLVWVNSDDLLLGSAAQSKAIKEKQKKEQEDSVNSLIAGSGLNVTSSKKSLFIIIGAVLITGLVLFFLIKNKNKKNAQNPASSPQSQSSPAVNIIKIPAKTQ